MKKIISIIAATAMLMSFTTVFAANTDNMQEVLISVKSRIDVPEEMSEFESNTTHSDYATQYHFEWRTEDYEKSMYVSCYDDGTITGYGSYDGYRERKPRISKMSAEDTKAIAEEFVKKINPDYPYELIVNDSSYASLYSSRRYFSIDIYVNGVYLANDGGSVSVDTETGKVMDFNIWYEPDTKEYFTDAEQFISEDEAQTAYIENFPMQLVYRSYYDEDDKEIFYPVYTTTDDYNEYINAVTGEKEAIDFYKYTFRAGGANDMGDAEMSTDSSKEVLTPWEIEELDNISGLISKEDIVKQIKENKTLSVPSGLAAERVSLTKDSLNNIYVYGITLNNNSYDDNHAEAHVRVNAQTGEILSYFYYTNDTISRDTYSQNDAAFKALAGKKAQEYKYDDERQVYVRYVNGIEVMGNTATMMYKDDILTSYYISYSDADFPSIDGVMSAEDAAQKMFEQTDYKAACVVGYNEDGEACFYPVYSLNGIQINPFTGKAVDWRNEEITVGENEELAYGDISGHYAEQYINALAEYGIGFEGNEFKPDEKITQADALKLLDSVTDGGSVIIMFDSKEQTDYAYSRAIRNSIITENERDDNTVITRETASIYLIRAIGAEQYAKYNDIYVTPFDDVTENKGYIALLNAMGVVNGDGTSHFNPKREITRAEFAVMLYNYLNR